MKCPNCGYEHLMQRTRYEWECASCQFRWVDLGEHNKTCSTCRFCGCKEDIIFSSLPCKRHAPVLIEASTRGSYRTAYPLIGYDDWCGDWEEVK